LRPGPGESATAVWWKFQAIASQCQPGVDGIKEYKIVADAYRAEFGMTTGSQMLLVSGGGTNRFDGDAFEYLRNKVLDVHSYFGYLLDGKRNPLFQRSNFWRRLRWTHCEGQVFLFCGP
jgi:hypothetical protein